jgi:hypothetical protein
MINNRKVVFYGKIEKQNNRKKSTKRGVVEYTLLLGICGITYLNRVFSF